MKFSFSWIQEHIAKPLPEIKKVADVLSFKSMEVESIEGDILDVKVLPNRAHDCLSHRGLARELAVLFDVEIKDELIKNDFDVSETLQVVIDDSKICYRYIAAKLTNVKVGKSPKWLSEKLESIGQRSISNVVDITNFVMNDIGQPMHAFDADKVVGSITIRQAKKGEKMTTLDKRELVMYGSETVIADDEGILALAGVKGGIKAEVTSKTSNIILESANFNPILTRKTSDAHNLKTDASKRFESDMSSSFAKEAMNLAVSLFLKEDNKIILSSFVDVYPKKEVSYVIGLLREEVENLLGCEIKKETIITILNKLGCEVKEIINVRETLVEAAKSIVGSKYKRGASVLYDSPLLFDCSSLVSWVSLQAGIVVPRVSIDQFAFSKEIKMSELLPGDLLFTNTNSIKSTKGKYYSKVLDVMVEEQPNRNVTLEFIPGTEVDHHIDHVGIYVGGGQVVHASSEKGKVVMEELETSEQFKNEIYYRRIVLGDKPKYRVIVPLERKDLRIKEDLIEEIGRIIGYEEIKAKAPALSKKGIPHKRLFYETKIKNILINFGYSEIFTYTFGQSGEVEILKALAEDKTKLRTNLGDGVLKSLEMNLRNAPLLGTDTVRVFEFGNVFSKTNETRRLALAVDDGRKRSTYTEEVDLILAAIRKELGTGNIEYETKSSKPYVIEIDFDALISNLADPVSYEPLSYEEKDFKYVTVSAYPFIARDIAVWSPAGKKWEDIEKIVSKVKNPLITRVDCFDTFTKIGEDGKDKTSFAFRIVLQSMDKTLTDDEANIVSSEVCELLKKNNYEIR